MPDDVSVVGQVCPSVDHMLFSARAIRREEIIILELHSSPSPHLFVHIYNYILCQKCSSCLDA